MVCLASPTLTVTDKAWYSSATINAAVTLVNFILLICIMKRFRKQRTTSNILILHLIAIRLGFSFIGQLLRIHSNHCKSFNYMDCYLVVSTVKTFNYASGLCIVLISIERYMKITKVKLYKKYFSNKKIIIMLVSIWVISLLSAYVLEPRWSYIANIDHRITIRYCQFVSINSKIVPLFTITFILILPPIAMAILYTLLYKHIKKNMMLTSIRTVSISNPEESKFKNEAKNEKKTKIQVKTAFYAMAMCLIYVVLLYPVYIVTFCNTLFNSFKKEWRQNIPAVVFTVTYTLQVHYPMIESSLYLYINENIRKDIGNILHFGALKKTLQNTNKSTVDSSK